MLSKNSKIESIKMKYIYSKILEISFLMTLHITFNIVFLNQLIAFI